MTMGKITDGLSLRGPPSFSLSPSLLLTNTALNPHPPSIPRLANTFPRQIFIIKRWCSNLWPTDELDILHSHGSPLVDCYRSRVRWDGLQSEVGRTKRGNVLTRRGFKQIRWWCVFAYVQRKMNNVSVIGHAGKLSMSWITSKHHQPPLH